MKSKQFSSNGEVQYWQCPQHGFHSILINAQDQPVLRDKQYACPYVQKILERRIQVGGHYIKGNREVVITGIDGGDVVFQDSADRRRSKIPRVTFQRLWKLKK
jgi:hypothetical protein